MLLSLPSSYAKSPCLVRTALRLVECTSLDLLLASNHRKLSGRAPLKNVSGQGSYSHNDLPKCSWTAKTQVPILWSAVCRSGTTSAPARWAHHSVYAQIGSTQLDICQRITSACKNRVNLKMGTLWCKRQSWKFFVILLC